MIGYSRATPLTYFLTFSCYGTRLHGAATGSVDSLHNQFGAPLLPIDPRREDEMRRRLKETPFSLDQPRRAVVLATAKEVSAHRRWRLLAAHVRTNHIHIVVQGETDPDKMLDDYKAYATRRLKEAGFDLNRARRWTEGGSTRFLWTPDQTVAAMQYVIEEQGVPMEVFVTTELVL